MVITRTGSLLSSVFFPSTKQLGARRELESCTPSFATILPSVTFGA